MKISPTAAYQYYKPSPISVPGDGAAKKENTGKTDTVTISGGAAQKGEFARLGQSIAAQVETSVPKARMDALRAAIEGNTYRIPTALLADSLLGVTG